MKILIQKASCGVKMSGQKFWELLVDVLHKMGFAPTIHDNNDWIKPREDGCYYVAIRVDDFIVVAKDCAKHADQIKKTFNLRSEGKIDYFLGCDARYKKNVLWETFAKTSIHKAIAKVKQAMGDAPAANTPSIVNDHPEEDNSTPLNNLGLHHYHTTIGCLNWIVTLRRMGIGCATISSSRFSTGPHI